MAVIIVIEIIENPIPSRRLKFTLTESALGYSIIFNKLFIAGTPLTVNQIQIGATAEITFDLLFLSLQASADTNLTITAAYPFIYINFNTPGDYLISDIEDANEAFTVEPELIADPEPEPIEELDFKDFSIEIIDTYENDRILIEEITRIAAPVLSYESGEDIYEPLMTSELTFDMRVDDGGDAHFLHLFTADENRYKVKLNSIDPEENSTLIWQGYLLPDLYKEPYQKENLFIEFTAIDMLSTLKNKFFLPWEYYRKINVMRLFGEILAKTGLSQPFIIKPSVVPASPTLNWWFMNLDLSIYAETNGGKNVYEILSDVLQANQLSLKSYKGFWWVEGVTRKIELSGEAYCFDASGVYLYNQNITREIRGFNFIKGTMNYAAITPWKTVELDFSNKGENNLFSEDVVDRETFFGTWTLEEWNQSTQKTSYLSEWVKVGAVFLERKTSDHKFYYGNTSAYQANDYIVSEATTLINYYECKQKPFVYPGVEYFLTLDIDIELDFVINFSVEAITENLNEAYFDKLLNFMILIDGVEIKSNRPSNINGNELVFVRSYVNRIEGTPRHIVNFKLEHYFEVQTEGYLSFRFLPAITTSGLLSNFGLKNFIINPKELKISADADYDNVSIFKGVRAINYTSKLSIPVNFTCDANNAIKNSFGLGQQIMPYEQNIPVGTQTYETNVHTFPNGGTNQLNSWRFNITDEVETLLFKDLLSKACYLTRADGYQQFFNSLYTNKLFGTGFNPVLYYLTSKVGRPKYPKAYQFIDKIEAGDAVNILLSKYPNEDYGQRLLWKVYGETAVQTFRECVVNAAHYVRPSQLFSLEGTVLGIVFPGELIETYFADEVRQFVTTRLSIDLVSSKTVINSREVKYEVVNDISYE